jgi:6-phosphogluconolactonase
VKNFDLLSFATADELAHAAAGAWLDEIAAANRAGKPYCVALSGGRIAQKFFTSIVEQAGARKLSFAPVRFFWADERCVPPDDQESNFRLANELLLTPLNIPESQIHRIRGEESPGAAAKKAGAELRRFTPQDKNSQPVLDLIILGMGEDGHIASLFPNTPAAIANCTVPFSTIENSPKPPSKRISLSYTAIAAARQVWVLVSGAGKELALRKSLNPNGRTPLAQVLRSRSHTRIFSDIRPD